MVYTNPGSENVESTRCGDGLKSGESGGGAMKRPNESSEDCSDAVKKLRTDPKVPITFENRSDLAEKIQKNYLLEMPEDFWRFWEFCYSLNPENPENALLPTMGIRLVGPYDYLSGSISDLADHKPEDVLSHWRYYYDPPEFQTVLASVFEDGRPNDHDGFHIGYFRDDPKEMPVFVASNGAKRSHKLNPMAENIFGAVYNYITNCMNSADPFKQTALQKLKESVHTWTSMKNDFSLEAKTRLMKARDKKKLAPTFHGAGLVVPYNKDTMVGYREIPESNSDLKKIFQNILDSSDDDRDEKFDILQELVTNVQFANDEGDPGMGLELGLDLLSHGGDLFHATIEHLLTVAYSLLGRDPYGQIIKSHLKNRTKGVLLYKIPTKAEAAAAAAELNS